MTVGAVGADGAEAAMVMETVAMAVGAAAVDAEETEMGTAAKKKFPLSLPALGVGLGYRSSLRQGLQNDCDSVDFLEIIADHYLDANDRKLAELEELRHKFTLIPHAINLSLGSAEGLDRRYLDKLATLIRRLNPPWWSEHLSFTVAEDVDVGHLCPLPRSHEALAVLQRNVETVRSVIDTPLILENITYGVEMPGAEMNEGTFLDNVVASTGCKLLLDVTNLYINSVNHGYDPGEVLDVISPEDVVQLHFVGVGMRGEQLIDNHATAVQEEVWELLKRVVARFPVKGMILERDQKFPVFEELAGELERARRIGREFGRWG